MRKIKATVSITTYNHERYIAQAIESSLMQETNFDYEILIGEDDSKDRTRTIVKDYKRRFPDKIKILLNDRKNVIYVNGRPTGRWNFVNNIKHAKGAYIALLEGDDYWTDPFKLQKQVDFLYNHPECAICFHSATRIFEDEDTKPIIDTPPGKKSIYNIEDLLDGNFIVTCSCMFRKGLIRELPEWFVKMPMGDWPLHILNAHHGYIGYIDENMSVYRIHRHGRWLSQGKIKINLSEIKAYNILRNHLDRKYFKFIKSAVSHRYYYLAKLYKEKQNRPHAILSLMKCYAAYPTRPAVSYKHLLCEILRLCFSNY